METFSLSTRLGHDCQICLEKSLRSLNEVLQKHAGGRRVIAIIDQNVERIHGGDFPFEKIVVRATEQDKSLATVERILARLIELRADRGTLLLGVGGGITTDICGFVASIFKRGVDFGFVPTTLLAMVDASIGGKNGVNMSSFKNMVGNIRQPRFVYVSCDLLRSLPLSDFRNALPEMWKAFLIGQHGLSDSIGFFRHFDPAEISRNEAAADSILYYIKEAIRVKCRIVELDELERGERRLLNLGHTFAHALEHCVPGMAHGEAVGIGLVMAARNCRQPQLEQQLVKALNDCGLRSDIPGGVDKREMLEAMRQDKKITAGSLDFVGFDADGKVCVKSMEIDALRL